MKRIVILGCGYVGRFLVEQLRSEGVTLVTTTTTEARLPELAALGTEPVWVPPGDPRALTRAFAEADAVIHLAPPERTRGIDAQVAAIRDAVPAGLTAYVYGSTTGAFGAQPDPAAWIDEDTPPGRLGARGERRLAYERTLSAAGLPLRVVRIAGIYGPHRTLHTRVESGQLVLFHGGPYTSRIHVEDLARILAGMLEPNAPPLVIGCDDEPALTVDVARYTLAQLGRPEPPVVSLEAARAQLSPAAIEMRLGGRRCRSKVRPAWLGPLRFPTYREGVRASLVAEGLLPADADKADS